MTGGGCVTNPLNAQIAPKMQSEANEGSNRVQIRMRWGRKSDGSETRRFAEKINGKMEVKLNRKKKVAGR